MKKVIILGVTGSIGMNAVDVVRTHRDEFQVVAVAALRSREKCEAVARELGAKAYCGENAALQAVEENDADVCLVSTVGMSGLKPTMAAIEKGMDIALATKEVMVMAGEFVTAEAKKRGVKFLPVDSEHSAIFQCLGSSAAQSCAATERASHGQGGFSGAGRANTAQICAATERASHEQGGLSGAESERGAQAGAASAQAIERLILTASGGPFLEGPADLSRVTVAEALNHPRWKMGPKVTIDSSTMMNKGFEILEARWLFDVPVKDIEVVVHPESIVHSLVTFTDGSTLAQLSPPDMRVAIQYALTWPRRLPATRARLDLAAVGSLNFRKPDPVRFPCLRLVKEACEAGGCMTAVLAAADEWAVQNFIEGKIKYTDIARKVEECLEKAPRIACDSLDAVWEANDWTWKYLSR